jgi:lysyl-tRNA synthetase class 2
MRKEPAVPGGCAPRSETDNRAGCAGAGPAALASRRAALEARARILRAIRRFFLRRRFLEVETPVRIPCPALESHIDAIPAGDRFLRTSPELHMKRLVTAGYKRIFQMGPCFRAGEMGNLHNPEFTMLEWYRSPAGYLEVLRDAENLIPAAADAALGRTVFRFRGRDVDLRSPWERIPVAEAFRRFAGWDPVADFAADRFDLDLVHKVEPALTRDRPVVLLDYPLPLGALAKSNRAAGTAERWELYIGGIEIANAFTELTDPDEQRQRFLQCVEERKLRGQPVYPLDEPFLKALDAGMPPCAGVALGVDRLAMVLTDAAGLDAVLPFRHEGTPSLQGDCR